MSENFPWGTIITSILSGIAIVISTWCLFYSWEANKVSKEALKLSKTAFLTESRPYLNARLIPFKETGSYFSYTLKGKSFVLDVLFEVKNSGKIPAKNISVTGPFDIDAIPGPRTNIQLEIPPKMTLGPDQTRAYRWSVEIGYGDFTSEEIKKRIESNILNADVEMVWSYTSSLDEAESYKTNVAYTVTNKNVTLIKGEMH